MDLAYNATYESFLDDQTPVQILFGGSSSGKSVFLAQRAAMDLLHNKRNYLIVRNVAKTIRQSTFNEIGKAIAGMDADKLFKTNQTDMVITAATGYQILSCGLDDVQKLKSITPAKGVITDIWVEEATEIEYQDFKELDKRLRGVSDFTGTKRMTLSFNPILQSSWLYTEFFSAWDDSKTEFKNSQVHILKTTYKDNAFLTPDDIKRLENEKDPYYYNVYTLGNWGILGAVIFKNWTMEDCTEIKRTADNHRNGLDFGFAEDPATIIRTHYDKKHKTIYILDEFYQTGLTNDLLSVEIRNMCGREYIKCDSAEPKSIQELRNLGINARAVQKGKDSVVHGLQWLQQQKIVVDLHCQNTKNELQQYQWKTIQGQVVPIPIDKHNHLIDALRYAYEDEALQSPGVVRVQHN